MSLDNFLKEQLGKNRGEAPPPPPSKPPERSTSTVPRFILLLQLLVWAVALIFMLLQSDQTLRSVIGLVFIPILIALLYSPYVTFSRYPQFVPSRIFIVVLGYFAVFYLMAGHILFSQLPGDKFALVLLAVLASPLITLGLYFNERPKK